MRLELELGLEPRISAVWVSRASLADETFLFDGRKVNGAGLAMNTNDVLTHHGGYPVNFIDTGGKATAATIKECFRLILLDHRVRLPPPQVTLNCHC